MSESYGSVEHRPGVTVIHTGTDAVDTETERPTTPRAIMQAAFEAGRMAAMMRGKVAVAPTPDAHTCRYTQVVLQRHGHGKIWVKLRCVDRQGFLGCKGLRLVDLLPEPEARQLFAKLRSSL